MARPDEEDALAGRLIADIHQCAYSFALAVREAFLTIKAVRGAQLLVAFGVGGGVDSQLLF